MNGRRSGVAIEPDASAKEERRIDIAEYQSGVGHRGVLAAGRIAGRTGHRAGALRADAQHPALFDPGDAATAGTDAAHVHRRKAGEIALQGATKPAWVNGTRPWRTSDTSNVVPPVSNMIASLFGVSATASRAPAIGAIEGPELIARIGAR